jgi:hypothetical protein
MLPLSMGAADITLWLTVARSDRASRVLNHARPDGLATTMVGAANGSRLTPVGRGMTASFGHFLGTLTATANWRPRTVRRAHRVMCEIAHGPKPAPGFVAAHTCGKGREGCVNPRHLRWASQKENMADKLLHGTSNRTASMQQNFEVHVLCATCGRAADDWQPKRSGKGVMLVVSCHGSTQLLPLPVGSAVLAFDVPVAKRTG